MSDAENVPPITKETDRLITVATIRARISSKRKNSGATGASSSSNFPGGGQQTSAKLAPRPASRPKTSTPSIGNSSSPPKSARHTGDDSSGLKRSSIRTSGRSSVKPLESLSLNEPSSEALGTAHERPVPLSSDRKGQDLIVKYNELAAIADEMLTYCHLLEGSRARTQDETCTLRETIRELETLLDSARQREINHLKAVEQQREAMVSFDKRYFSLKSRAKDHIRKAQEERDKYRQEVDLLSARLKDTETELATAQSTLSSQSAIIERYQDQSKNMPTEKEITQMRLQLRRLEDENGRLATERAALLVQIDELGTKRDGQSSRPSGNRKELEDALALCRHEKEQLLAELSTARQQAEEYQQYCEVLLEKVPPEGDAALELTGK